MAILDWNVDADSKNIRPGSIELQRTIHRQWHEKIKSRPPEGWLKSKPLWRVRTIDKLEIRIGRPIFGEVLEIGAGSAVCSAFAAKREDVTRVTAMDYDQFCVEELMPTVFAKYDAPVGKLRRALGSYNRIPDKDFYDFIIGVGALHHAEDLGGAFREIYSALKPGGILLISDVCECDHVANGALDERYESLDPDGEQRYGRSVRLKDNGDHWYRFSEWLTAGRSAGFEVLPYLFDAKLGEDAGDEIFRTPALWRGFQVRAFQPYFSDRGFCDSLLMILQKPRTDGSTPAIPRDLAIDLPERATSPVATESAGLAALKARLEAAEAEISHLRDRSTMLKKQLLHANEKLGAIRRPTIAGRARALVRRLLG
jgi:SAM-dependent methyltransferase